MSRGLLIFDLDGTLMDTRRDLATGINLMRQHYGLTPLPLKTVAGFVGNGIRMLVTRALADTPAHLRAAIDLDQAVQINYRFYRAHMCERTRLYAGVAKGLPRLHQAGWHLALVSNKKVGACRELLKHFAIKSLFSVVLGGDSTKKVKPHPQPLMTAMRRLKCSPAQTWMIGDHVTDLEAARRAGVRSVFVTYGIGNPGTEKPNLQFNTFSALTRFFLKASDEF